MGHPASPRGHGHHDAGARLLKGAPLTPAKTHWVTIEGHPADREGPAEVSVSYSAFVRGTGQPRIPFPADIAWQVLGPGLMVSAGQVAPGAVAALSGRRVIVSCGDQRWLYVLGEWHPGGAGGVRAPGYLGYFDAEWPD